MSKKDDPVPRQLYKQIGGGTAVWQYSQGVPSGFAVQPSNEWEYVVQDTPHIPSLVNRQYIDLQGYTLEDLTFFAKAVDIQKDKFPSATAANGNQPVVLYEYDFLTTREITDDELSRLFATPPAFLESTLDLMECVYGEQTTYFLNSNIAGGMVPTHSDVFGSGNAIASDRLYWTRALITVPGASPQEQNLTLTASPANLVVSGLTMKESDLVYIERLRRSYTQER